MKNHQPFWIGFFAASIIIVPVALGAWAVLTNKALEFAAFYFGIIVALLFLLAIVLFFREKILGRLFGVANATAVDVTEGAIGATVAVAKADWTRAELETKNLARSVVSMWAWSSFYRWVIGTAIALLLAFGTFTGTVLLFEQIRKLEEQTKLMALQSKLMEGQLAQADIQNEILTLSLTRELRAQIKESSAEVMLSDLLTEEPDEQGEMKFVSVEALCSANLIDRKVRQPPSQSVVDDIVAKAQSGVLSNKFRVAVERLLNDSDPVVSLGALLVSDKLGDLHGKQEFNFRNMFFSGIEFQENIKVNLYESIVGDVSCDDCDVHVSTSVLLGSIRANNVSLRYTPSDRQSIAFSKGNKQFDGLVSVRTESEVPKGVALMRRLGSGGPVIGFYAHGVGRGEERACSYLEYYSQQNSFLRYFGE